MRCPCGYILIEDLGMYLVRFKRAGIITNLHSTSFAKFSDFYRLDYCGNYIVEQLEI